MFSAYLPALGFEVLYGLFSVWGARSAAKKQGIKRDKLKAKYIAALAVYFLLFAGGIGYYDYYTELTTIKGSSDDYRRALAAELTFNNTNGYGFAYEGGWSSVDLEPYYVKIPKISLQSLTSLPRS